ncbi:hypothetical protein SDC9_176718 [bioreactor metagenome]|uniref:Uncharacterized protein n=1 Tax=bioreactor metagenome TaxID=1076179 RepID=A0A645GSR9_9ZZZZ|nr:hypothetical protein [Candidatus Pelethousia sp.]
MQLQSLLMNALRILLYCLVFWSLVFWLMSRLRVPERYLEGMPIIGRNIIVVALILLVAAIQLLFNSHWRAAVDSHWWTFQIDWYIAFFIVLKLVDSMRIRTKAGKAEAAEREAKRMQGKKAQPTHKRVRDKDSRRSLG